MKIAVCLSGQYRTGKLAYKNIQNFFGDLYGQCDFFIHTWDTNTYRTLKSLHNTPCRPDEKLSCATLAEYRDLYNPAGFMVDDYQRMLTDVTNRFGPSGAMVYLYHSRYHSMQLMRLYENSMKFQYDIVLYIRPDILFDPSRRLRNDINELMTQDTHILTLRIDDVYLLGHRNEMIKAAEFYTETQCCRGRFDWLLGPFYEYLKSQDIKYASMKDTRFTIMRKEFHFLDTLAYFNQLVYLNTCIYSGTVNYSVRDLMTEFVNSSDPDNLKTTHNVFDHIFGQGEAEFLRRKNS